MVWSVRILEGKAIIWNEVVRMGWKADVEVGMLAAGVFGGS